VDQDQIAEEQTTNPGGLAPADRQCQYLLGNGRHCHNWALRGHDHCHRHHRYLHARPERPIDVPLLEDEGSLTYVLSQTIQSLAWGTLPTANGHAILAACRLVQNSLNTRLETAKLRVKLRRLGIPEHEIFDEPAPEPRARCPEPDAEPGALSPDPAPTANPIKVPPSNLRFRDLKKDWDQALQRTGSDAGDMYFPRYNETRDDFNAARATPFEHLAELDREVERARALAKAQAESCSPTC
jgi:hypothetical protein